MSRKYRVTFIPNPESTIWFDVEADDEEHAENIAESHAWQSQNSPEWIICTTQMIPDKTTGEADPLRVQRDIDITAGCIYRGALATCHASGCPVHSPPTA